MDYEKDIHIDETSLDIEWLDQAARMFRYCQHAEKTRRDVDFAKEHLDVVKAEIDKEVRTHPRKYGLEKVTESTVTNAVIMDDRYKRASQQYIDAKYESNMANVAVRAMDQRKTALENLVRLHGQQYFAGPRVPRDLSEERQMRQERSNEKVAKAMRRRRHGS